MTRTSKRILVYGGVTTALLSLCPLLWDAHHLRIDRAKFTEEWYKALVSLVQLLIGTFILERFLASYRLESHDRVLFDRACKILHSVRHLAPQAVAWIKGEGPFEHGMTAQIVGERLAEAANLCRQLKEVGGFNLSEHEQELCDRLGASAAIIDQLSVCLSCENSYGCGDEDAVKAAMKVKNLADDISLDRWRSHVEGS